MVFGTHIIHEWDLPLAIDDDSQKIYHAHEPFPAPRGVHKINNEQDSVTYCTHHLIVPVLRILRRRYPAIEFAVSSEVTLEVEVTVSADFDNFEDDEYEDVPIHRMVCRVDMIIRACRTGEMESTIVLLIEHKRPGVLHRHDWTSGFTTRRRLLRRNAIEIARQTRKYISASLWNIISVFDSTALVGLYMRTEDQEFWNSQGVLPLGVYFEDDKNRFICAFMALITTGLRLRRLI